MVVIIGSLTAFENGVDDMPASFGGDSSSFVPWLCGNSGQFHERQLDWVFTSLSQKQNTQVQPASSKADNIQQVQPCQDAPAVWHARCGIVDRCTSWRIRILITANEKAVKSNERGTYKLKIRRHGKWTGVSCSWLLLVCGQSSIKLVHTLTGCP